MKSKFEKKQTCIIMSKYLKNAIVFNKQGNIIMHFKNQINLMFDSQLME